MAMRVIRARAASPLLAWLVSSALIMTGCAHSLQVKNLDLYKPESFSSQTRDIKLGIIGSTTKPEEERFLTATVNALKRDGFKVTYPFLLSDDTRGTVDYIVKVSTSSEYKGSGWNFLINWPGFLIWTPAWHGYDYRAIYGFDVDITDTQTNTTLPRMSVPVDLDIRHADMNRTWTEGLGWVLYSAIAFVGGILFVRYDNSVTPLLVNATDSRIADYVESKIAARVDSASPHVAASASTTSTTSASATGTTTSANADASGIATSAASTAAVLSTGPIAPLTTVSPLPTGTPTGADIRKLPAVTTPATLDIITPHATTILPISSSSEPIAAKQTAAESQ